MIDHQEEDRSDQGRNEPDWPQAVGIPVGPAQRFSDIERNERAGNPDKRRDEATAWFPAWNDKFGQCPYNQADDESSY